MRGRCSEMWPWRCAGWLVLAVIGLGCDDFLDFDTLRCGNGVIEPAADEDCDGLPGGSPYRCGPAGTPAACRLLCDGHADCPAAWRCGVGGLCAAPAGRFGRAVVTRLDGDSVGLGDLDGDGWLDVVSDQRSALSVAYGRGDGAFDEIDPVPLPLANRRPAIGDADGDGRADVALVEATGVTVFRGTASRTLEPVLAPVGTAGRVTQITPVRVRAPFEGEALLTVGIGPDGVRFSMFDTALDAAALEGLLDGLDIGRGQPPTMRAAQLDGGEPSADELLLTFAGRPEVHVLDVACVDDVCTLTRRQVLVLAGDGVAFRPGAFGADLDLDGWPDVIVQARGAMAAQVAWGSADGLGPLETVRGLNVGGRDGMRPELAAVVDLGGDARPDLLLGGSVRWLVGADRAPRIDRVFVPRRPLTRAGVADVDADGLLDVYGHVDGTLQFALARGDGQYVEVSSGITDVEAVEAVDLDGNRITDLVVQRAGGTLEVYFGAPDGALGSPALVGRFGESVVWGRARLADLRDGEADVVDDLVVYDEGRVYAFAGSAQRNLASAIPSASRPQGVAIGRFADGPGVYVGGRDTESARADRLITAEALASAEPAAAALSPVGCAADLLATASALRVVDWDRDGVQEVLQFDQIESDGRRVSALQVVAPGGGEARCRVVAPLDGLWSQLGLGRADVDGDGADEVLAVLAPPRGAGDAELRQVAVWPLGPDGVGDARLYRAPMVLEHGSVIDLGQGPALVVAAEGGLHRVTRVGGPEGELTYALLAPAPRGVVDTAPADVDGDGLVDLVLKTPTSVWVQRQSSCSARDAWDGVCARVEAW